MRVSRHKGVLVGMKADQCAGSRASSWHKGVSVGMKVSVGKRRVNRHKACQLVGGRGSGYKAFQLAHVG